MYQSGACYALAASSGRWGPHDCKKQAAFVCMKRSFTDAPSQLKVKIRKFDIPPGLMYVGSKLAASCEGFVGTNHVISFRLVHRYLRDKYRENITHTSPKIVVHETHKIRPGDSKCSRYLKADLDWVLHRPTPRQVYVFESYLTCVTHDVGQHPACTRGDPHCVNTAVFDLHFKNKSPTLKVYHHDPRSVIPIVHLNRSILLECESCVGSNGNLSWYAFDVGRNRFPIDPVSISYKSEDHLCGLFVWSTIQVQITSKYNRSYIACESHLINLGSSKVSNEIEEHTPPIHLIYGPQTPEIHVDYHEPPDHLVLGWNLTANCTACVGNGGKITWSVLEDDGSKVNLTQFWENVTLDTGGECVKRVTSHIELVVTASLRNTRLVCSTYNMTYLSGYKARAASRPFDVPGFDNSDYYHFHFDHLSEIIPAVILFQLILLALIFLRRWLLRHGYIKGTKRRKQEKAELLRNKKSRRGLTHQTTDIGLHSTCVDTGTKDRHFKDLAHEMADKLNISVPEATRRLQAYRGAEKIKAGKRRKDAEHKGIFSLFKVKSAASRQDFQQDTKNDQLIQLRSIRSSAVDPAMKISRTKIVDIEEESVPGLGPNDPEPDPENKRHSHGDTPLRTSYKETETARRQSYKGSGSGVETPKQRTTFRDTAMGLPGESANNKGTSGWDDVLRKGSYVDRQDQPPHDDDGDDGNGGSPLD